MALFSKKKNEIYVAIPSLIGEGEDYHVYIMKKMDIFKAFCMGAGIGVVVSWLFFRNEIVTVLAGIAVGIYAQGIYENYCLEKRRKNLLLQFKDLLEALTSSYSAGKNTLEAFMDAESDMEQIYGNQSDIVKELSIIVAGMQNNINIEDLLRNFAARSGLDDIESFADVFRVALRQGANIKDIIASTRDVISDKIEIEMDINTIMAGNKNELNIMMLMPLIIIVSLGGMGSDMTAASNTPMNVIIKIIALGLFLLAYRLGKKYTTIEI